MPERRALQRTDLKVFARGYVNINDGKIFPFGATVINLSKGGAKLNLNPDARDRFNRVSLLKEHGLVFEGSPVSFYIISYIHDNVSVKGSIVYASSTPTDAFFGVKFGELGEDAGLGVQRVIESKPELEVTEEPHEVRRSFASLDEFTSELTVYAINSGKEEMFFIAGELFAFVGMHLSPSEEPHLDLIESVDNPGKVFCPDCKTYIDMESMI